MNLSNKQCSSSACVALLFFISLLSPATQALDDGLWTYNLFDGYAEITGRINSCPSDMIIPSVIDGHTVNKIGNNAFYNTPITSVVIPDTVTSIGDNAFRYSSLASATIPGSVSSFGINAFEGNELTSITIPEGLTELAQGVFSGNKLTSVTIPPGVTKLGKWALAGNNLTNIIIPENVVTIERSALEGNDLESVLIPSSVATIGDYAFRYSPLVYIHFYGDRPVISSSAFETNSYTNFYRKRITYCDTGSGWPGEAIDGMTPNLNCNGDQPYVEPEKKDIAFVLRGFSGTNYFENIEDFRSQAEAIMKELSSLSLGEVSTYDIFYGGIDPNGLDYYNPLINPNEPLACSLFIDEVRLPAEVDIDAYKQIGFIFTNSDPDYDDWAGGFAGSCQSMGLLDSNGNPFNNDIRARKACWVMDWRLKEGFGNGNIATSIHESIHAFGHGGHDYDTVEELFPYSVVQTSKNPSFGTWSGPIDSYPVFNSIYITKWLTEDNITENRAELVDYVGGTDKSAKYLLRLSEKNDFNCEDEWSNPYRCHRYQELYKDNLVQSRGTFIRDSQSYFQLGVTFEPVIDVDDVVKPGVTSVSVINSVSTATEGTKDQITITFSENIALGKGDITVFEDDYISSAGFIVSVNRLPDLNTGWTGSSNALAEVSGKNLIITSAMNGEKKYSIHFGQGAIIDWGGNSVTGRYCAFAADENSNVDGDGDGVPDCADAFPSDDSETTDNDSDGTGDNADLDSDGDGINDAKDVFPLDYTETIDTDGDGIGNNRDPNDDDDSHDDWRDIFPLDASETTDTDSDGIGNNADTDDDGDGVSDSLDAFPLDSAESIDTDGDGIGNNTETDDDCDCVVDADDAFPLDSTETIDTDGDGVGDNSDVFPIDSSESADSDGDGIGDNGDAFPLNADESLDTDSDGIGNNIDNDDDGDGVFDADDPFPLDSSETQDTDGDGVGDNSDAFPSDSSETIDTDSDGIGNNTDLDDDGDGVADTEDMYPLISLGGLSDSDGDGIPDDCDNGLCDGTSMIADTANLEWRYSHSELNLILDGCLDTCPTKLIVPDKINGKTITSIAESAFSAKNLSSISLPSSILSIARYSFNNNDLVMLVLPERLQTLGQGAFSSNKLQKLEIPGSLTELAPYSFSRNELTKVIMQEGVKTIRGSSFTNNKIERLELPSSIETISGDAFYDNNITELIWASGGSIDANIVDNAFQKNALTKITLPANITDIGSGAFSDNNLIAVSFLGDRPGGEDAKTQLKGSLSDQAFENNEKLTSIFYCETNKGWPGSRIIVLPASSETSGVFTLPQSDCDFDGVPLISDIAPSDPTNDSDGDGVDNNLDYFPMDPNESFDTDFDGIGNNSDPDDDNDGVADGSDAFPLDSAESVDTDTDGTGNNADIDDDNDTVLDGDDAFPLDASESVDTDSDGVGNNADTDDDGDGVADGSDAFPLDSAETLDTDSDGTGNNADTDDDGDGVADGSDAFPLDSAESVDTDSDGTGNNADTDDDNDGVADENDSSPLDPTNDSDDDGVANNADVYPENNLYTKDSDSDGMPDAWETRYGLDPNDPSDATSDQDNDGITALNEFLAGTIPSGSLDIDGNAQYDALTDGLLLLRGMFGLDGNALIGGTVASNATYTATADIEARIAILGDLADIDGNGEVDALTDGLLTLRYLFGLEGDTLIAGVVASDATRTSAADIEAHLKTLMPAL